MMHNKNRVRTGSLLVAEPFMMDGYFKRTVVQICDHHADQGTVGFILNRPTNLLMHDIVDGFPEFDAPVLYGGPVSNETIHYLHRVGDLLEKSTEIARGIFWGGDFTQLKFLIENKIIKRGDIQFYLGYSGWSEGQLDGEIKAGSWIIAEPDVNYLFNVKPTQMWSQVLKNIGKNYCVIADMPDNVSLN